MSSAGRWPRDLFAEAVWASSLPPPARLVALAYADHAGRGDTAWLSYERLAERTRQGRSTCARALKLLVADGWLEVAEPARQHRSARYRLLPQQSQSGTAEECQSGTPESASSPGAAPSSPAVVTSSPGAGPDCSSSPQDQNNNNRAREDPAVIVVPEDRQPSSDASLADRLRGLGVEWSEYDVASALVRLGELLGGGAEGAGLAQSVLSLLAARRRPRPIGRLGGYLASLNDDQVLELREVEQVLQRAGKPRRSSRTPAPARPPWCGLCHETTRRREDADTGLDLGACPACHPSRAAAAA